MKPMTKHNSMSIVRRGAVATVSTLLVLLVAGCDDAADAVKKAGDKAADVTENVAKSAEKAVSDVSGSVGETAQKAADSASSAVSSAAGTVSDAVSDTATGAAAAVSNVAEKAGDAVKETGEQVAQSVTTAATSTASAVSDAASETAQKAQTAVTQATTTETSSTETPPAKTNAESEPEAPVSNDTAAAPTPPAPPAQAEMPKREGAHGAAIGFFSALMNGEADRVASLVQGTDLQVRALRARADYQLAGRGFRAAFIKRFGRPAWVKFNSPEHLPEKPTSERPPFNARLSIIEQNDIDQMMRYKPQENGDEATYPDGQNELRLVRRDGVWKLDASTFLPPGDEGAKKAEEIMAKSALQIKRFARALGDQSITADDIDVELGRAMVESLYGFDSPEPHRFDVTQLK